MHLHLALPDAFPVARYRFEFEALNDLRLPAYSGSLLRGIFGHAVKEVTCMTKAESCEGCPLLTACAYPEIFEAPTPAKCTQFKGKDVPQSYIIEPPDMGERVFSKGDRFQFEMVLLGKTIERVALVNFAWKKAFERGIRNGGKALLVDMQVETESGFCSVLDGQYIQPHSKTLELPSFKAAKEITIEFETPMRLQQNGRAMAPNNITATLFLTQLLRRLSWVSEVYFGGPLEVDYPAFKAEAEALENSADLNWYDWARYSNRQQKKMHLGGVLGKWTFYDLSPSLQQLLYLGQWLHAGKNTTFGLGKYKILP